MLRQTGRYKTTTTQGEPVRAFIPYPLPPDNPPLQIDNEMQTTLTEAVSAVDRLKLAGALVPSTDWFLYGFVRKEAVLTSQIEGTQATLRDVLTFETTHQTDRPEDVEEVCNYVEALTYARRQLDDPGGLPLSTRLLCNTHRLLLSGARGADKLPGEIRRSQNWIGGTRPGNARFVPPPPEQVPDAMSALERWLHADDPLPMLVKIGLAHVQFESIHPFLDGNGRIGRMLIALLLEHWGCLDQPLLYISVALRQRQQDYYAQLAAVRDAGDWEGWSKFFLNCVRLAADDGVRVARALHALLSRNRSTLIQHERATVAAIHLLDHLPRHPVTTIASAAELLGLTAPPVRKAIELLESIGILRETSGKQRDRTYAYHEYLRILTGEEPG